MAPRHSRYSAGASRDWLKTKVSETGAFVITGYIERKAIAVAERQLKSCLGLY